MTEEFDAVFFDAGGTLFDMDPPRHMIVHEVLERHGLKTSSERVKRAVEKAERLFDDETASLQGANERLFWKRYDEFMLKDLGFKGDVDAFESDLSRKFDEIVPNESHWKDFPDTRPLLEDLSKRDFTLGVISNATDLLRRVLDRLDLTKYFDVIVVSDEVGVRKPSASIFWIASKEAATQPGRCMFIGDKYAVDVVGAKNAGMNAVLLDRRGIFADVNCIRVRDLNALRRFL